MKDPAVLIYFDKWISATNGMRAEFRAWYFDLLIYQYDKGGIPNDIDELAGICRVRPSEYKMFEQMLEQVLEQKFSKCEDGKYRNDSMSEVMQKRKSFVEKRSKSGTIGHITKMINSITDVKKAVLTQFKKDIQLMDIEELNKYKDKQVLKQVLKQKEQLYIDVDVNVDINKDIIENEDIQVWPTFQDFWDLYDKKTDKIKAEAKWSKLKQKDKEEIMRSLPDYVKSTPDRQFRKDAKTYLNNEAWKNEIIIKQNGTSKTQLSPGRQAIRDYAMSRKDI